jgi:hypothetical protein
MKIHVQTFAKRFVCTRETLFHFCKLIKENSENINGLLVVRLVRIIGISMKKHVQCEHVVIRNTHNIMSYHHDRACGCVYHAIAINRFGSSDQYTITVLVLRFELR